VKVLLVLTDLYNRVGGGQTVYRNIVEATPDVEFFYFLAGEPWNAQRPPNTHPIPLLARRNLRVSAPPPNPVYVTNALEEADQVARSVAGQDFDIVDIPDFLTFGRMLKSAFGHHLVQTGRIVLAMHGNISVSIDMNWGSAGDRALEQRILEREQFDALDGVYAISPRYMREWRSVIDRHIHYVDPAHFAFTKSPTIDLSASSSKPSIYCIGRSERRKGNDLFIELVRWLDRKSFDRAAHIGDQDFSSNGVGSAYILENIAKARGIDVEYHNSLDRDHLSALFAKPSIIVLPVRYDTLNLVALEALFAGCLVAVSSRAGVCDYLDETHPSLPYVKLDLDNFYSAVADLQDLVENFEKHRRMLHTYLADHPPPPAGPLDMGAVYRAILSAPPRQTLLCTGAVLPYKENRASPTGPLVRVLRQMHPRRQYHGMKRLLRAPRDVLIKTIKASGYLGDARFFAMLADANSIPARFQHLATRTERNTNALRERLHEIYCHSSSPLYRCNFWLDIARIERILGNELMAVTYELRLLRLLGKDTMRLLPKVVDTLNRYGFLREAKAAEAMYTDPAKAEPLIYAYLEEAHKCNVDCQNKPFDVLHDHRTGEPKVAAIVSLYKAEKKLPLFLTALSQQTLLKQGRVEIVLVDSGSPTKERAVLESHLQMSPLNVIYARSRERETIQAAWNRGIGLARAPYLVFLGVDETLYPEALEVLAHELDQNPDTDWVMANSLVTAVDEAGLYKNDIMPYDRAGGTKDHVYLETCYLSWVGGMYRKSLHERFGYYDGTFGAAGDTEFKNRILPHIKVKFIDKTLGIFLNYPDGQTSLSTMAEIEDLRAWYIHRTPGGVRYAFENRPVDEAEKLLCTALGYRKSYCRHMSCDIEYAHCLAQHIKARNPTSFVASSVETGLADMLGQLRGLELAERLPSRLESLVALAKAWRTAGGYQSKHRKALKSLAWPCYRVLNDNRYEQHSWTWRS
jgi:glycosyltransferase involved in cell wall biosynthesis